MWSAKNAACSGTVPRRMRGDMQGVLRELRDGVGRPVYRRADALAPLRRRSSPGEAAAADMDEADAERADTGAQLQQVHS